MKYQPNEAESEWETVELFPFIHLPGRMYSPCISRPI